jgi:hypothetical protein
MLIGSLGSQTRRLFLTKILLTSDTLGTELRRHSDYRLTHPHHCPLYCFLFCFIYSVVLVYTTGLCFHVLPSALGAHSGGGAHWPLESTLYKRGNTKYCLAPSSYRYDRGSGTLSISTNLNISYANLTSPGDTVYTCAYNNKTHKVDPCSNPCPGVLSPTQLGYSQAEHGTTLNVEIQMQAIMTAIAVNTGILSLATLTEVTVDHQRTMLLEAMMQQYGGKSMTIGLKNNTSTYIDSTRSPFSPIYW